MRSADLRSDHEMALVARGTSSSPSICERVAACSGARASTRLNVSSFVFFARRRGFTLLEILLAVALIGLLSAALVSVAVHLVDSRPRTAQEIFWEASHAARRTALKSEHEVQLSFDAKEKKFVVADGDATQSFPVPDAHDLTVDFLLAQATGGSLLIGGQLVDTHTLPAVSFYPDGTCSPFRVQFRVTGGPAHVIAIDPWTCAAVLSEAKSS